MKTKMLLIALAASATSLLAYAGHVKTIKCESEGKDYNECRLPGYVEGAHLDEQLSHADCDKGRTWGYRDNYVWVDRGCRGKFRVTYSDDR